TARLTAEMNKIRNFFTVDIGERLTKTTAELMQFVGGADAATAALGAFLPVAGAAAVALIGYSAAVATATGLHRAYTASITGSVTATKLLGGALAGVIAVFAAAAAGEFLGGRIASRILEPFRRAIEPAR